MPITMSISMSVNAAREARDRKNVRKRKRIFFILALIISQKSVLDSA
jgi:hypothetical protein